MTENIQKAKEILEKEEAACVLINKTGTHTSVHNGIRPMMDWLKESKNFMQDAVIADKVVGRAAAFLMVYGGVCEVYAGIISEPALEVFAKTEIKVSYETKVNNIINRTGTDICPMEKSCLGIEDPESAYQTLLELIQKMKKGN